MEQELKTLTGDFQAQLARVNEEKQAVLKEIFLEKGQHIQNIEKVESEKREALNSIRNYETEISNLREEISVQSESSQQLRSRIQLLQVSFYTPVNSHLLETTRRNSNAIYT